MTYQYGGGEGFVDQPIDDLSDDKRHHEIAAHRDGGTTKGRDDRFSVRFEVAG